MRRLLVLLLLTFAASSASAQTAPNKEGEYGGVVPGEKPDTPKKAKRVARGTLSWIGFEAKDGGAELFLQSGAPFEVSQRVEGATLIVHTNLTRLASNTWRKVDTRFFDTPIAGVIATKVRASRGGKGRARHGAGIDVRITFKSAKDAREAQVRTATEPDGLFYTYLTFGPGAAAATPES